MLEDILGKCLGGKIPDWDKAREVNILRLRMKCLVGLMKSNSGEQIRESSSLVTEKEQQLKAIFWKSPQPMKGEVSCNETEKEGESP